MGGDANTVDDERNWRASIFLSIDPLKMAKINTSRFDVSKRFGNRIDLSDTRCSYSCFLEVTSCWNQGLVHTSQYNNLEIFPFQRSAAVVATSHFLIYILL